MIKDLLTVRADRERYYYGMEDLFHHHPDFVHRLTGDAPSLLPFLLEGLVWRSRFTKDGMRRVNSYVKYFIIDADGGFSPALKAIADYQDPKTMSDCVIVLVSDTLWSGLVRMQFLQRKMWFILSLLCFMLSQAILPCTVIKSTKDYDWARYKNIAILFLRFINYVFSAGGLAFRHGTTIFQEYRKKQVIYIFGIPVPMYLSDRFQLGSFSLLLGLCLMLTHEPMLYCYAHKDWPHEFCAESTDVLPRYEVVCMLAMAVHWMLLADMAVFSTGLSAFVLVCGHVLSEVTQFLLGLTFLLLTFASAMSAIRHTHQMFRDVPNCVLTLFAITVMRYEGDYREISDEPLLLAGVFIFVLAAVILLLNLLVAQLNCSYEFVYQDMVGFARLNRAQCIVECLLTVSPKRWARFVSTLGLDKPLEFNEGDLGMAGGIATFEPASLHPTVEDAILRFGGSCSPEERWPEDEKDTEEDKFERMERLIHRVMKRSRAGKGSRDSSSKDESGDKRSGGNSGEGSSGEELSDSESSTSQA